ncbi:MAG TPA: hypothetical protein VMM55_01685, partial [Thermohalobaculum sp.]|nr:hypothetical protein [Thermohalobaculum sp.]
MSARGRGPARAKGPLGTVLSAAGLLALAGCGTAGLFADHDLPEAPGTAEAPWPRLVDTPASPSPGVYTEAAPDPLEGIAIGAALGSTARAAAERAETLSAPVVPDPPR